MRNKLKIFAVILVVLAMMLTSGCSALLNTVIPGNKAPVEMSSVEISEYADTRIGTVRAHNIYDNDPSGSGFFIDSNGTFVTNYHVIDFADEIKVELNDGGVYAVDEVVDFSEKYDLAILKVAISGNDYFELSQEFTKGETVYAIGSALGELTGTMTSGIISNEDRKIGLIDCIQMDAAISNGNSGGPLVNRYGEVIGVNSYSYSSGSDLNLAIKISMIDELAKDKNFSVNDYVEWWRKEIERSYKPVNSSDDTYYKYSILNTYQSVTGANCVASSDDDDYFVDGFENGNEYYYYDYDKSEYDEYVEYIKDMGYEYDPDASESDLDSSFSTYYSAASDFEVVFYISDDLLLISVYY